MPFAWVAGSVLVILGVATALGSRQKAPQLVPVAELFHQLDVAGVMDEADLLRGRLARLQQLGMLAQAGLVDQLEGQLDAPRLKWMPVRMPVSAVRIVINQRHPARHLTTLGSVLRGGSAGA